mgnify:CR=1 FL=1
MKYENWLMLNKKFGSVLQIMEWIEEVINYAPLLPELEIDNAVVRKESRSYSNSKNYSSNRNYASNKNYAQNKTSWDTYDRNKNFDNANDNSNSRSRSY